MRVSGQHFVVLVSVRMLNNSLMSLLSHQVLVIIDVKPKDLGLPTEAYISVEEIHDVSISQIVLKQFLLNMFIQTPYCNCLFRGHYLESKLGP